MSYVLVDKSDLCKIAIVTTPSQHNKKCMVCRKRFSSFAVF